MDYSDLIEQLLQRNPRAAAKLITIVENDFEAAEQIVNKIFKQTGNAYILGITGAPGSGKSTLISTLIKFFVDDGKKIGILAVDPTSPLTGGAILADRIRMKDNFSVRNVFIRSMANRGQLGGLARATEDAIKILDAYGCDIIIVETVGVGQSEVDICKSAQTVVTLLVPGMGDDIQAIKAGIMEITDIFAVNKMDLPGADKKVAEIQQMLELELNYKYESNNYKHTDTKKFQWVPEIVKVNSKTGENFDIFLKLIQKHKNYVQNKDIFSNYQINRIRNETFQILKYKITKKVERLLRSNSEIEDYIKLVMDKTMDPYSMANLIIKLLGIE
jgi:LAO/AO transport system kinase